jgi:hypothetical protein
MGFLRGWLVRFGASPTPRQANLQSNPRAVARASGASRYAPCSVRVAFEERDPEKEIDPWQAT